MSNKITVGTQKSSRIWPVLLIGSLSMFFAEVFSGASPLWFIDAWSIIVTFPLYTFHLLFFLNLAMRCRRMSLESLYLWGVLFSFYEFWITKVMWCGFFGEEPLLGTFLGIAIFEFIVLAFFWHPIMSFMLPIFVYEVLTAENNGVMIIGHKSLLSKTGRNKALAIYLVIVGSASLTFNTSFNIFVSFITGLGSILIIWLLYNKCKKIGANIKDLYFGRRGMIGITIYLAALYAVLFPLLLPERIPGIGTILITIALYLLILLLIYSDREVNGCESNINSLFSVSDLRNYAIFFAVLLIILALIQPLGTILFIILIIFNSIIGTAIFLRVVLGILKHRILH